MQYSLRTQHLELTDLDRDQIDNKLNRIKKHLMPPFTMDISMIREQLKSNGETVNVRINIEQGKRVFHAERSDSTVQNALDAAIEAISAELKKEHDKKKQH